MLLMFCIIEAINVALRNQTEFRNLPHPESEEITGIQACGRENCIAFAYVPAPTDQFVPSGDVIDDASVSTLAESEREEVRRVHQVIRSAMANNKGGTLSFEQALGFKSPKAMDDYMLRNQGDVLAGVILQSPSPEDTTFILQLNRTYTRDGPGARKDEAKLRGIPLQVELSKAIGRELLGTKELDIDLDLQVFAHPQSEKPPPIRSGSMAPLFLFSAAIFPFVMQMSDLITERELKLRQSLNVMGMMDSAYWVSWHIFHIITGLLGSLVLCLAGIAFRYDVFVHNDFGVLFFTFFFFSLAMTGMAYMISTMIRTTGHALVVGICFFFLGFILYFVVVFGIPWGTFPVTGSNIYMNCTIVSVWSWDAQEIVPLDEVATASGSLTWNYLPCAAMGMDSRKEELWERKIMFDPDLKHLAWTFALIPPTLLSKSLIDLGIMADTDRGLSMQNVTSYCFNNMTSGEICDSDYSVGNTWGIWFGLYCLYSLLALFFDNILADPMGVRKPAWYFFLPSYWGIGDPTISQEAAVPLEEAEDADVKAEEQLLSTRTGQAMAESSAIEVRGLRKTYTRGGQPFHAVKGLQLAMDKQQLFSLLGPNGAGKTTLINMLVGVVLPTAGEAVVSNFSVSHPCGIAKVREHIGVCPQFDMLWDALTALEHLELLADIKGLPSGSVRDECHRRLEEVRLMEVKGDQTVTFSGGMKRRLSVALSLIGDPRVLFLDEPTTGMDPISRRCVWDVIEAAKQDRAIVLTTHSMEEADILGDRIGIMAKGRLRCLGSSVHLKSKFGAGYKVSVAAKDAAAKGRSKALFREVLDAAASEETGHHLSFKVSDAKTHLLPDAFARLEDGPEAEGIDGVQLSMSTLEDVFLRIARDADTAESASRQVVVTLRNGEAVSVIVGSEMPITSPTGQIFKCVWGLDDVGNMSCINTIEMRSVQLTATCPEGSAAGAPVQVSHEGQAYQVTVPEGVGAGQDFQCQILVENRQAVAVSVDGDDEVDGASAVAGQGMSEAELQRRVERLSSSYASQSRAIFTKSVAVQKSRCCSNCCLISCPALSIAIIFVMQFLLEFVFNKPAEQRCTYCGPADDAFGKSYCGGKDCFDFFFHTGGWGEVGCGQESAKEICSEIASTCGGNGHPSCFWPGAPNSKGHNCDQFQPEYWPAGFDQYQDDGGNYYDYEGNDENAGMNGADGNAWMNGASSGSCENHGGPVQDRDIYKDPSALPIAYVPSAQFLADAPILYTGSTDGAAKRIVDKVFNNPLGSGSVQQRVATSMHETVWALFSLLMLPRIGCGERTEDTGRLEMVSTLPVEAQAAVCAVLQRGREHAEEPCCMDFTATGDSPDQSGAVEGGNVWTDPAGVEWAGSGRGQEKVREVLSKMLNEGFADQYFERGEFSSTMYCVQPRLGEEMERRLAGRDVIGLEEALAIVSQVFDLPASVHPDPEPNQIIPDCTADGTCETPNGRWAQTCDREMHDANVMSQTRPGGWNMCSHGAPCADQWPMSMLMPDSTDELPSCLCRYLASLRFFSDSQLQMVGDFEVLRPPTLPFGDEAGPDRYWKDLLPLGIPGLFVSSPFVEEWGGQYRDSIDPSIGSLAEGGDAWWVMDVMARYSECICSKGGIPCDKYRKTGQGDCITDYDGCEYDENCACSLVDSEGYPSRSDSQNYNGGGYSYYGGGPDGGKQYGGGNYYGPTPDGGGYYGRNSDDDGCFEQYVMPFQRNSFNGLTVLAEDCGALEGLHQVLHILSNISKIKIECINARSKEVEDHETLDDEVYNGHFKLDIQGPFSSLPGVAMALDFMETAGDSVQLTFMYNDSARCKDEYRGCNRDNMRVTTALNQVLQGILAERAGNDVADLSPLLTGVKDYPPSPSWGFMFDLGSSFGPFLITLTFLIIFPSIVVTLVQEKAYKIRIMMRMMGLGTSAFWSITYLFWCSIFGVFTFVFLIIVNFARLHTSGYRIGMFANVDGGVQVMFFLGYMLCTVSFAFLWGTLLRSIRVAQVSSVLWIITTIILSFVFDAVGDIFNSDGVSEPMKTFLTLFPPLGCYRALTVFRSYADEIYNPDGDGSRLTWASKNSAIATILTVQWLEAVIFMAMAIYFDQVLDTGFGVPRHPLWFFGLKRGRKAAGTDHMDGPAGVGESSPDPDDVKAERTKVESMAGLPQSQRDAVITNNLRKVYDGKVPKEAVKPLSLGVRRGECFGMLGPNGAGKTTTINMLVGFTQPSAGDATVEGLSILGDMERIYSLMGVCPQHDLLWDVLTPRQHLSFFGRLKNLQGQELSEATLEALRSVNLLDVIDTKAGTFSGGMKRRLSVAISLIGMPLVCYLDEPSTGLDPASRRLLWDCVRSAKRSRAVLLTTHSMEEAEGLCDRLGIFVDGRLRCVGAPKELTLRFGGIFVLTFSTTLDKEEEASNEVVGLCPEAAMTYALAGTRKYELPANQVRLSVVFKRMTESKERGVVVSWGLSSATLEDAFIKIAKGST